MTYLCNNHFSVEERQLLEFVLQCDFPERQCVITQLNSLKASEIFREYTPYSWYMEFRTEAIEPGYAGMSTLHRFVVDHKDGTFQTEFCLYEKDGRVFELEIYNWDSSELDFSKIMEGQMILE